MPHKDPECTCYHKGPFFPDARSIRYVGIDTTVGDRPEIRIIECTKCNTHWLCSVWDDAGYSQSGKWINAPIDKTEAETLPPESVSGFLARQVWCLIGGSSLGGAICKVPGSRLYA